MDYYFSDIKDHIIKTLDAVLGPNNYLMKGGQALALHFKRIHAESEARFSRDIDFSFGSSTIPFDTNEFRREFERLYNSQPPRSLFVRDMKLEKIPPNDKAYFGIRVSMNFRTATAGGKLGHKEYFKDLDSTAIVIDFTCNEFVNDRVIVTIGGIKVANVALIVAEKLRALCSNLHEPELNPMPRAKDFYDVFAIYAICFRGSPAPKDLKEMKDLLRECFAVKNMPLDLLDPLGEVAQKAFHGSNFQQQVRDTLEVASRYKRVTYDQVYSDTIEFLDKIRGA
jgi:predicted nucleotidyltransferase component of viral defense system